MEIFPGSLKYDVKLCAFILKYIIWMKNKHCKYMQVLDKMKFRIPIVHPIQGFPGYYGFN